MSAQPLPPSVFAPQLKRRRRRSLLLRFMGFVFTTGFMIFLAVAAVGGIVLWHTSKDLPNYDVLANYEPPVMTRVHASDGRLIAEYAHERRIYVPINTVPKRVIQAYLSAEDKNFFEHQGLDYVGIVRAVFNHVVKGQRLTGASTITQQVAKNFLLSSERTMTRKLKEAILAIRIEQAYSKEKILELYLNEIYLGLRSYGIAAAALNYYGKELRDLTVPEAAYLAALPKAPENYHPFRQREAAVRRRNWVIRKMAHNGFITRAQAKEARESPLEVNVRPFGAKVFAGEYFAEEVRRTLIDLFGEDKTVGGGLSVRTTMVPRYQRMAKKALVDGLVAYDRRRGWRGPVQQIDIGGDWASGLGEIILPGDIEPWRMAVVLNVTKEGLLVGLRPVSGDASKKAGDPETGVVPASTAKWATRGKGRLSKILGPGDVIYIAPLENKKGEVVAGRWKLMQKPAVDGAIVAMDPHTGRVLALVGGFTFGLWEKGDQFNRAVAAQRQPGSSFKPFVYATAMDNGYTPATVVLDAPIAIEQGGNLGLWKPSNYGGKFYGPSTLRTGIVRSRNLMTVRLARDIGMPLIAEYARRFGVYDNLLPVLSMALGAGETTLLRMAAGYSMIANGGKQIRSTLIDRIQDRYGRTVWRHDQRDCIACSGENWEGQDEPELDDARRQIIDPHTAYQVTSMLEAVIQRGTGTRVKVVGKPLAGKTGTTNDEKDAWFMGYAPDMVVGVYVGFDNPKPMGKGETGGSVASPIFRDFMKMALADKPAIPFRRPPGIKLIRISRRTGTLAYGGSGEDTILEAFKPENEPPDSSSQFISSSQDLDLWLTPGGSTIGSGRGLY